MGEIRRLRNLSFICLKICVRVCACVCWVLYLAGEDVCDEVVEGGQRRGLCLLGRLVHQGLGPRLDGLDLLLSGKAGLQQPRLAQAQRILRLAHLLDVIATAGPPK